MNTFQVALREFISRLAAVYTHGVELDYLDAVTCEDGRTIQVMADMTNGRTVTASFETDAGLTDDEAALVEAGFASVACVALEIRKEVRGRWAESQEETASRPAGDPSFH